MRGTDFKWLDVVQLVTIIFRVQDPLARLDKVRYFSAPALGRFAGRGIESSKAQETYHRALLSKYGDLLQLKLGIHSYDRHGVNMPMYVEGEGYNRKKTARVWHLVEKKTDINLALAMYRNAYLGQFEQMVLCSNDSDAEPVLEALREDFPQLVIGVVAPVRPPQGERPRRPSTSLSNLADWSRSYILDEELAVAQLPDKVATNKKPALKPAHWFPPSLDIEC